jgi:hypothetical protein
MQKLNVRPYHANRNTLRHNTLLSPYLTYLHVGERYREEVFTVLVQLGEVVKGLAAANMVRKSQEKRLVDS